MSCDCFEVQSGPTRKGQCNDCYGKVAVNGLVELKDGNQPEADISMDHAQFHFWPCTTWDKAIHARAIGISLCWVV